MTTVEPSPVAAPEDPNLHWDGAQWHQWDGASWIALGVAPTQDRKASAHTAVLPAGFEPIVAALAAFTRKIDVRENATSAHLATAKTVLEKMNTKITRIGSVNRVTVYPTSVKFSAAETYPIDETCSVEVVVEGYGTVVQGWVFKRNEDLRDMDLTFRSPSWRKTVTYTKATRGAKHWGHTNLEPRDLRAFADEFERVAAQANTHRRDELASLKACTDGIAQAGGTSLESFDPELEALGRFLKDTTGKAWNRNKAVKRLRRNIGLQIRRLNKLNVRLDFIKERFDEVERELVDSLSRIESQHARPRPPSTQAPASGVMLISQLGDLRAAGLLSEDEFEAKKTEILKRI